MTTSDINIETIEDDNTMLDFSHYSNEELYNYLQQFFAKHMDVQITEKSVSIQQSNYSTTKMDFLFLCSDSIVQQSQINDVALPAINEALQSVTKLSIEHLQHNLHINWTLIASETKSITIHRFCSFIFEGNLIVYIAQLKAFFALTLPSFPTRQPSEASSETSIRGSRDGLVEDISSNVALLRRRIRSVHFVCKTFSIGKLTNTKVAVMYLDNKISEEVKTTLFKRIEAIHVDSLLTIGEIEQFISDKNRFFSFPIVDHSGRPDFIAKNILEGRFVVLVDNNPIAVMGPSNLSNFLRSPEDSYFPILATNVGILIRLLSLIISVFLPSFYIAITSFHPDQIPFQLLSTIGLARTGLPVESPLEMFLIMFLMELFREATFRMPSSTSQAITVVGGLIIGEASINAGLVSPIVVVVSALTIVANATFVNQSLASSAVILRFSSFIISSLLGMFGFISAIFVLIIIMSKIRSFGLPYLLIFTPAYWSKLSKSFLQIPIQLKKANKKEK